MFRCNSYIISLWWLNFKYKVCHWCILSRDGDIEVCISLWHWQCDACQETDQKYKYVPSISNVFGAYLSIKFFNQRNNHWLVNYSHFIEAFLLIFILIFEVYCQSYWQWMQTQAILLHALLRRRIVMYMCLSQQP